MTTSYYCLSLARNVTGQAAKFGLGHHINLPRSTRVTKVQVPVEQRSLRIGRVELLPNFRTFGHPFASISSFANADDDSEGQSQGPEHGHEVKDRKTGDEELPGMAKAFGISTRTATAISVVIAFAALSFPLFMQSVSSGMDMKIRVLSYATLLFGFYMAWNIGANDVANAMGTSVGSGALTLRQAVMTAAVLEFSGALLMGRHVTSTMQKGILVAEVFQGKDMLLFAGLLSSLAAAGTWLQVIKSLKFKRENVNELYVIQD